MGMPVDIVLRVRHEAVTWIRKDMANTIFDRIMSPTGMLISAQTSDEIRIQIETEVGEQIRMPVRVRMRNLI